MLAIYVYWPLSESIRCNKLSGTRFYRGRGQLQDPEAIFLASDARAGFYAATCNESRTRPVQSSYRMHDSRPVFHDSVHWSGLILVTHFAAAFLAFMYFRIFLEVEWRSLNLNLEW